MRTFRRHTGHGLAGTMIFLVLAMMLWLAVFRQVGSCLRIEKAYQVRVGKTTTCSQAMAWALTLLETGEPPVGWSGQCSRRMVLDGGTYVVTYTETGTLSYHVEIRPKQYWYDDFYPLAPATFGS